MPSKPISLKPTLVLSIHLPLDLPNGLSSFPHRQPACLASLPHTCHMPCTSHSSYFEHPGNVWWGVRVMKLLIKQLPPVLLYIDPRGPKCLSQHHISWTPSAYVFPSMRDTRFYNRIIWTGKITVPYALVFIYVESKWEDTIYEVCLKSIRIGTVVIVHWVGCVCNQSWHVRTCLNNSWHKEQVAAFAQLSVVDRRSNTCVYVIAIFTTCESTEQRICIKFCFKIGKTATETYQLLQ